VGSTGVGATGVGAVGSTGVGQVGVEVKERLRRTSWSTGIARVHGSEPSRSVVGRARDAPAPGQAMRGRRRRAIDRVPAMRRCTRASARRRHARAGGRIEVYDGLRDGGRPTCRCCRGTGAGRSRALTAGQAPVGVAEQEQAAPLRRGAVLEARLCDADDGGRVSRREERHVARPHVLGLLGVLGRLGVLRARLLGGTTEQHEGHRRRDEHPASKERAHPSHEDTSNRRTGARDVVVTNTPRTSSREA
jgi:hypothetical protein